MKKMMSPKRVAMKGEMILMKDKENKESGQTEYTGLMEEGSLDAEVDEVAFDVLGESSLPVPLSPIWLNCFYRVFSISSLPCPIFSCLLSFRFLQVLLLR